MFDEKKQSNNVNLARLFLAGLVVFSHSFTLLSGSDVGDPLYQISKGQLTCGAVAVDIFFLISGYFITGSFVNTQNLRVFFKKRILRIYPAFIMANLFGLVCIFFVQNYSFVVFKIPFEAITKVLLLFGYRNSDKIFLLNPMPYLNRSLWTIQYEGCCYVATAILGVLGFLKRPNLMKWLFFLVYGISIVYEITTYKGWFSGSWARLLPFYLLGSYLYFNSTLFEKLNGKKGQSLFLVVILFTMSCVVPLGAKIVLPMAGALLFIKILKTDKQSSLFFGSDYSYGMYLYAYPIQQTLIYVFGPMQPVLLFSLSILFSSAAAWLSWHLIEKRFLSRRVIKVEADKARLAA